ncbi:MAG: nuclear transport factor 2 family protein [Actinomycetota bacterium]
MAQQASSEAAKILRLEQQWTDAYREHSVSVLTSLLAPDFTVTVESGRTFGRIGYMSHAVDASVQVAVAEQSDLRVHLHGNVAVVTGSYREVGTALGKPYQYVDRFTDIWMKSAGRWQLIASQYSVPVQQ